MKKVATTAILWIFILGYIFYFGLISFMKFNSFGYRDFDLAVHDLSVWNILHGSIFNSILGIPFLGNHMHLILFFVAPIYAIFKHPLTLLFLQTIALGITAFPLFRLSERLLDRKWALHIAICYLFYPALGYTNLFEFHPTAFATLFLMLTFYYYEQGSFFKCAMFMFLSCICQENIALAVIMFGVMGFFHRRCPKWVVAPILMGGLYFIIALLALSYFNNNTVQFISIYRNLGNTPLEIILNIFTRPSLLINTFMRKQLFIYLFQNFLPLSFIPLFSPLSLLPAMPFFLQHMLSNRLTELTIFYHYSAEIIPFLFIGFIYGVKFLLKKQLVTHQKFLKVSLLSIVFLSNVYLGPHFALLARLPIQYKKDYLDRYKDELINKIPLQASVVATFEFLSHLSGRHDLYSFHHVYMGFYTLSNKKYLLPKDTEYALIDFNDFLTFAGFYNSNGYRNLQGFLSKGNWRVEDFMETIVLFKKNIDSKIMLCQDVKDPAKEIENKILINIEGDTELLGYNLSNTEQKDVLDISLYFRCVKPTNKDINIILDIVDKNNKLIMRKARPICYRIFPTNSWKKGGIFKDRFRIKILPALLGNKYKLKIVFFDYRNGRICKINGDVDDLGRALLAEVR